MRIFMFVRIAVLSAAAFAVSLSANAGMPRGAELMADEQDADPATGVTTARGNAEIRIEAYRILGRADRIDVDPGRNEIQFTGHALITVGDARYESDQVTCSLDFQKCAPVMGELVTPAPATTMPDATAAQALPEVAPQNWPPPAGSGAAVIKP